MLEMGLHVTTEVFFASFPCDRLSWLSFTALQPVFGLQNDVVSYPTYRNGKGKVIPYSLPSVGPGADPGVQAVSPQVT